MSWRCCRVTDRAPRAIQITGRVTSAATHAPTLSRPVLTPEILYHPGEGSARSQLVRLGAVVEQRDEVTLDRQCQRVGTLRLVVWRSDVEERHDVWPGREPEPISEAPVRAVLAGLIPGQTTPHTQAGYGRVAQGRARATTSVFPEPRRSPLSGFFALKTAQPSAAIGSCNVRRCDRRVAHGVHHGQDGLYRDAPFLEER